MKITCNLYDISNYFDKFSNSEDSRLFVLLGKEGVGKTTTILNLIKNYNFEYTYFSTKKGEEQLDLLLESFGIKKEIYSKMNYMKFFSPNSFSNNESFKMMVLNDFIENLIKENKMKFLIFDDFNLYSSTIKNILIMNFKKIISNSNKIKIIIVDSKLDDEELLYIKSISSDTDYYVLEPLDMDHLKRFLNENGYLIPPKIVEIIYRYSDGYLNEIFRIFNILREYNFMVDKNFSKSISEENIEIIKNIILTNKNFNFSVLGEDDINLILFLFYTNDSIKIEIINKYINISMEEISKLENYQILKRLDNDSIYLSPNIKVEDIEDLTSGIKKTFIKMRAIKYLEEKKDFITAGLLYISLNIHDNAHHYLREYGMREYYDGNFRNALRALKECWKIHPDDRELGLILIKIYQFYEDYDHAIEISEKLHENFKEDCEINLYHSVNLYRHEEFKNSYEILNRLISTCNDIRILSHAYFYYSILLKIFGKMDDSVKYLKISEENALKEKDFDLLQKVYRFYGNIFYEKKDLKKASEYYFKSAEICKEIGNYYDLASTYNNLGNIYSEIDVSKGMEYYNEALSIARKYWYPTLMIALNLNMAIMKWYNFEIKEAMDMFMNSYIISFSTNNYTSILLSSINIGELSLEMGNFEDVLIFIERAVNYTNNKTDILFYDELKFYFGLIKYLVDDIEMDINEFEELKNSELEQFNSFYYYNIVKYNFYRGNFQGAVKNFSEYMNFKNKIFSIEDFIFISYYLQNMWIYYLKNDIKINEDLYNLFEILDNGVRNTNSVFLNEIHSILTSFFEMIKLEQFSTEEIMNSIEKFKIKNIDMIHVRLLLLYSYILKKYYGDGTYYEIVKDLILKEKKYRIFHAYI